MSVSEGMVLNRHSKEGVHLLSIDGGGTRGLSTLIILEHLMHKIRDHRKLSSLPKPCEVFDLASGIGTGGLIVIMLFRLRMTIDQAINAYLEVTKQAFSERKRFWWQKETFKASRLEGAILQVIMDILGLDETKAKEVRMMQEEGSKSFVCATSARDASPPTRFRTWSSVGELDRNCTIVEAARATCAAPGIFKGINLDAENINPRGIGCNNPTEYTLQEAITAFPSETISCTLSLGTGISDQAGLDSGLQSPDTLPRNLIRILGQIAIDCQDRSRSIVKRFPYIQDSYFRINVDYGLQNLYIEEWQRVDDVKKHTEEYLARQDIGQAVKRLIDRLLNESTKQSVSGPTTLPNLNQTVPPVETLKKSSVPPQPDGQDATLEQVDDIVDKNIAQKTRRAVSSLEKVADRRKTILSIDGGGFRGYACLLTLHQLMRQLTTDPDDPIPSPCQVFDLICGTSTGGLIAVLLGRLGLDCVTAMRIYVDLGISLFGGLDEKAWDNIVDQNGLRTEAFENKLSSIVEEHTGDKDALLKIQKMSPDKVNHGSTDVFITTVEPVGASSAEPYRLRSYNTPSRGIQPTLDNHAWTVCGAIRAAIASPSFLKPFQIGSQKFLDAGGSGSANPVWDALKEAELRWSKSVEPVIISLGTGLVSLFPVDSDLEEDLSERYYESVSTRVQVGTKSPKSKLWSDEFAKQLIRVSQDTELKHQGVMKYFSKRKQTNNYIRFNPNAGVGDIDMSDITQIRMIAAITNAWLKMPETYTLMDRACQALKAPASSNPPIE